MKTRRIVSLVSLGCPKNLVDSEGLVGTLLSNDFRVVANPKESDVVIVNTCGFLDASRKESLDAIRGAVALKFGTGVKRVLVAGCMVGNYRELLEKEAPGVDALVGFGDYHRIDRIVEDLVGGHAAPEFGAERRRVDAALTPRHYAYLKISEGCDHTCAFCVIPSIRGAMRSFPTEDLVERARTLAGRGVRELNVVAQDSTVYGSDLYGELRLPQLLRRLDDVEGLDWIRLLYAYPTEVTDGLIDVLASGKRVLPWLDVPIQHAADNVLARMKRGHGRAVLEKLVERLRRAHPRFAIRTTVIVGFPGETEADFETLLQFLAWAKFDRLGAFRYSREPGSAAADLDGQVPEEVKDERWHRLMALQQRLAFDAAAARVGSTIDVLVDAAKEGPRPARCRSWLDAPEIDANVLVDDEALKAGEKATIRITEARGYDLAGTRA